MKITVINGTEKHGVTYKLKEIFLQHFKEDAEITQFYLPKDCPSFCVGCTNCFVKGEDTCKDRQYIGEIEKSILQSDLIVMTSPCYAMHVSGAMKALLDHLCYRWMAHRPAPEMFGKRAVIITQCLGAGAKSTAKDIKHSLSWWGVSKIGISCNALMGGIVWENLSDKKQKQLTNSVTKLARKFSKMNYAKPATTAFATKMKFYACLFIKKQIIKKNINDLDIAYWQAQGWLGKNRPWKQIKK